LSPSPDAVLQSPAVAARLISECYSDVSPAMSSVQSAHSQSNFSSQSSVSPHRASPARQASSGKPSSLAAQQQRLQAQQQQLQAQQPIQQSLVQLRPVPQATFVQPGSFRQQEWQGQADDNDTSLSIRAVYSEMQQAGSLQSQPRLDQLQAAFKQGWPAVQTNPLYQKADAAAAAAVLGGAASKSRLLCLAKGPCTL